MGDYSAGGQTGFLLLWLSPETDPGNLHSEPHTTEAEESGLLGLKRGARSLPHTHGPFPAQDPPGGKKKPQITYIHI